jgi:hypothetical protein
MLPSFLRVPIESLSTMRYFSILLCHLLYSIPAFAQNHADCASALEICDKQPIVLPLIYGDGNVVNEMADSPCLLGFDTEANSAWIRWKVAQNGSLWFVIFPLNPADDIDFVLYRLPSGACTQKTWLRCMAAGDFSILSPCMGPTGLLPGEIDTTSPAGCVPGMNNFLAPMEVVAGEEYVLGINNFSSSEDTVRVEFCGSALLGCETSTCTVLDTDNPNATNEMNIAAILPNPANAADGARIHINSKRAQDVEYSILSMSGQLLSTDLYRLSSGANTIPLEFHNLPTGVYIVSILGEYGISTQKMIIKNL